MIVEQIKDSEKVKKIRNKNKLKTYRIEANAQRKKIWYLKATSIKDAFDKLMQQPDLEPDLDMHISIEYTNAEEVKA